MTVDMECVRHGIWGIEIEGVFLRALSGGGPYGALNVEVCSWSSIRRHYTALLCLKAML